MVSPSVHVAVGVVTDSDGKILIAKRADHADQGGLWEFPGGKLEPGELTYDALVRELEEEIGIEVKEAHPLIKIRHQYTDKSVLLDVMRVSQHTGVPRGAEGQPLKWVEHAEIVNLENNLYKFPGANTAILKALRVPDSMVISGDFNTAESFLIKLKTSLEAGLKFIQLRILDSSTLVGSLVSESKKMCDLFDARLILNSRNSECYKERVDGFHLTTRDLMKCSARPVGYGQILGASCHNLNELDKALEIDVDYVTISPVLSTSSHPEIEPIGWDKFEFLVDQAKVPVYALGGVSRKELGLVKQLGGHGIASISEFWA